jgi:hypothetical protein
VVSLEVFVGVYVAVFVAAGVPEIEPTYQLNVDVVPPDTLKIFPVPDGGMVSYVATTDNVVGTVTEY